MRLLASVLALVGFFLCVAAQQKIAPGDKLSVVVTNSKDLTGTYTVAPEGTISMPFIGVVDVKDMTTADAAEKIQKILKDQRIVTNPQVTVSFAGAPRSVATVDGAVKKPGEFQVTDTSTLDSLLQLAQPTETADLGAVRVTGPTGDVSVVDYAAYKARGAADGNPKILPGSSVYVTIQALVNDITILGAVARPGVVPFKEGMSLTDAIQAGGGPNSDGDVTRIRLKRLGGEQIEVNLKTLGVNPVLKRGDMVFVPTQGAASYIMVRGAVRNPGLVPYQAGMTVTRAIHAAGDSDPITHPDRAEIKRPKGDETTTIKVSLKDVLIGRASDPEVLPGDTVVVPFSSKGMTTGDAMRYAWLLATLLLLLRH